MLRTLLALCAATVSAAFAQPLPGTAPLTFDGDPGLVMVEGIHAWLERETAAAVDGRSRFWSRDLSSPEAYEQSIAANRARFRQYIGVSIDAAPANALEPSSVYARTIPNADFNARVLRIPLVPGVFADVLELSPDSEDTPAWDVVVLGDCDWAAGDVAGLSDALPPRLRVARRLVEAGARAHVPVLVNRDDEWSGNPAVRMTNQPHREFVYRAAFELGGHIIGYEVQKVLRIVDRVTAESGGNARIGVAGYGEGGLLALYAAAIDRRIDAVLVSGYFGPREAVHEEPIYRNMWRLLREFGDAEIASLIAPRTLVVEASEQPRVDGPPPERDGRRGGASGRISTPDPAEVRREVERARELVAGLTDQSWIEFHVPEDGQPFSDAALQAFADAAAESPIELAPPTGEVPLHDPSWSWGVQRQQVEELIGHTQRAMYASKHRRAAFWERADFTSAEAFVESAKWYRGYFHEEVIGRLPEPDVPLNPRTRQIFETGAYTGYEVMLDVYDTVFAYGILLVPKGMEEGKRRPVVVCQHGLEGTPRMVADPAVEHAAYKQFGCRLADEGFVVYAPQNPYIGEDCFRQIQRKANPLGYTLFSFIVRQHERHLDWLTSLPFVAPARIGFYGLSYGGKTAMRVPAILEDYALSICSGDFNEWIWKICSVDEPFSYMFTHEYEMLEWNLGNTFNYAEMSWLIFPRPFMVERGHDDGVGIDEWVAYEYARTRRHYVKLGLGNRTRIEFFDGPHAIHGEGTFEFLREHLWKDGPARD